MPIRPEHLAIIADTLRAVLRLWVPSRRFLQLKPYISASHDNYPCPSAPVLGCSALSVAVVPNGRRYRDSGQRYEIKLENVSGAASMRAIGTDGVASEWTPMPNAVSYHASRSGQAMPAPAFDMVAAGAGRVIAKVRGRSQFFFTFLDPMFRTSDGTPVPSTYFKLDPEAGQASALASTLLNHLPTQRGEARVHPAAIRFPAFRLLLATGATDLMVVNQDARPRTWHELDYRPPSDGVDPPNGSAAAPRSKLVSYARASTTNVDGKMGYRFHRVLSIGVGHEHWHEQTSPIYGGEMDSLDGPGLPPLLMERDVYRFFNGPVTDQGGFVDGTANYYVLAQLVSDEALSAGPRPDAYAVLWADEQAVFSERWRLVHPSDNEFGAFRDVVPSALVQYLARTPWYSTLAFDRRKFWCPCRAMHVGPHSGMATQRLVVIVSGFDPVARAHRLYSINWGFGTADRTWRWRPLPPLPGAMNYRQTSAADAPPPYESFGLREDMTLFVVHAHAGVRRVWFQRYLPADQAHAPNGLALALPAAERRGRPKTAKETAAMIRALVERSDVPDPPNGPMPSVGYEHPWHSLPEDTWQALHQRFSHMGCLTPVVDWRCQYYLLQEPAQPGLPMNQPLVEVSNALRIATPTLDWHALNEILDSDEVGAHLAEIVAWFDTLRKEHQVLDDLVNFLEERVPELEASVVASEQALRDATKEALRALDNARSTVRAAVLDVVTDQVMEPISDAWPFTVLSSTDRRAVRAGARAFVDGLLDAVAFTTLWDRVQQVAQATTVTVDSAVAELRALPSDSRVASEVSAVLRRAVRRALDTALTNGVSLVPKFSVEVKISIVSVTHKFELPALELGVRWLRRAASEASSELPLVLEWAETISARLRSLGELMARQAALAAKLLAEQAQLITERSKESAYRALLQALERLRNTAPFVQAERRTPLFSDRFLLTAHHRSPIGTILVHSDKRDDDLQPFAPFASPASAKLPLTLRVHGTAGPATRVTIASWHSCALPPCVPEATVKIERDPRDSKVARLALAFRCPHRGRVLDENIWRVWLAALPRDADGRFGAAPEILCELIRHERFKPDDDGKGWHRCVIDLPWDAALRAKAEVYCTPAGRDRFGTSLWFENLVGQPAPPDQLKFGAN